MERRDLFKILAASAVAAPDALPQHQHAGPPFSAANYQPRFFAKDEYATADRLCDIIVPSDEQSPGAHAAGVAYYIDTVLHYGDATLQKVWRDGFAELEKAAQSRFSKPFLACARPDQEEIVATMARNEANPETALEKFFVTLKRMTVEAYTLSEVGMRDFIGYRGDAVLAEFPGCTHPQHRSGV
jgi:gluconate 2-dehydrogenase gamma chain